VSLGPLIVCSASQECRDGDRPLILLGEGCRRPEDAALPGEPRIVTLRSPFADAANYPGLFNRFKACQAQLTTRLAAALNEIHGVDRGPRYWTLLFGPWLNSLIVAVMDRVALLEQALQAHPDASAIGLALEDRVVAADNYDFTVKLFGDRFNLQLCSEILEIMGRSLRLRRVSADESPLAAVPPERRRLVRWLTNKSLEADWPAHRVVIKDGYFSPRELVAMALRSRGKIWPSATPFRLRPRRTADPGLRRMLTELVVGGRSSGHADVDFVGVASLVMVKHVPTSYLEDYRHLVSDSETSYPYLPRAIFTANAFHFDEEFKHWAGRSQEAGANLLVAQHGGNHSFNAYEPFAEHEIRIADRHYAWAATPEQANDVAGMPPPILTRRMQRRPARGAARRILYGVTSLSRYLQIMMPIQTPARFTGYLDRQSKFAATLGRDLRRVLTVRIVSDATGWNHRQAWRKNFPEVNAEGGELPFRRSLARSDLYVCDHLMTTYLESLASNVPTVLFWDPADYALRDDASRALAALKRVGILYDSAESAAAAIRSFWPEVSHWWNESDRQEARRMFCELYAPAAGKGSGPWMEEFKRFATQ
jgi:putative transferase (TIGR04331 family)